MITLEDFFGRKPIVSHFRIFEATMYCHVSKYIKNKIELTIEMGFFVRYIKTLHNYRVYFSSSKVIVMSIDVNCDEEKAMRLSLE